MREGGLPGYFAVVLWAIVAVSPERARAADPTCDDLVTPQTVSIATAYNKATYDSIYKAKLGSNKDLESAEAKRADAEAIALANEIELGDIVAVRGILEPLFNKACANRSVVLYLNNWPISDVTPLPPRNPAQGELYFKLVNPRHTDGRDPWRPILSKPTFASIPVKVSVGFANGVAMQPSGPALPILQLKALPPGWFAVWAGIFFSILGGFWYLARSTTMLRDATPPKPGNQGPFSLARTQAALWFIVILAAYLFIGLITGDFNNSINSTALTLLSIGAGTVLGSAVIDAQKDTSAQRKEIQQATDQVASDIRSEQAGADPTLESQLKKLKGESEGLFIDILSDANGINFHRFQNAAWTAVLSVVFLTSTYQNLAMPEFSTTMLGLLGVSAGTYLGLKIPEPTTPTRPAPKTGDGAVGGAAKGGAGGAGGGAGGGGAGGG